MTHTRHASHHPLTRLAGPVALLLLAGGCGDSILPETVRAAVRGTVTRADDTPVPTATVVVEVFRAADRTRLGQEPTTTNGEGRYSILIAVPQRDPFDALLTVTVTTGQGATAQEGRTTDVPVRLNRPADGVDTVTVNIRVAPAAR